MWIAALFKIAKGESQPKCPATDECIYKMWYIHVMEYYLAMKNNEVPTHATIWLNLEKIMLNKRSQLQKDIYNMIPFI